MNDGGCGFENWRNCQGESCHVMVLEAAQIAQVTFKSSVNGSSKTIDWTVGSSRANNLWSSFETPEPMRGVTLNRRQRDRTPDPAKAA